MKKVLLFSGLGVVVGAVLGGVIHLHGVDDAFGFSSSDPNIIEVEQSEFDLLNASIIGSLVGLWGSGSLVWGLTRKERIRDLAKESPELFKPEVLIDMGFRLND